MCLATASWLGCGGSGAGSGSHDAGPSRDGAVTDAGVGVDGDTPRDGAPPPDGASPPDGQDPDIDHPNELLFDRHFRRGFSALGPESGVEVGTLIPGFAVGAPAWELGQWGSATSLSDASSVTLPSGAARWEDQYGAVTIGPAGSSDADLSLYVNAYDEYGGVYRTTNATRTWPHLLGQQRISPPGQLGPGCPPLSELTALDFSVDARLLFDRRNLGPGYDPSRHAGHYLMYFTVQNLNATNPGYGDYLWFGISLYDDRDPRPGLSVSGDDATGKLIYNIGLAPLSTVGLVDNQWHRLEVDFLPHILLAIQEAWDRGYLADSRTLADYRIGGMNLGWEIPGLNAAELQIRNLSLVYH